MKTLKVCGWAVIFTVTLLLVACASTPGKVTSIDTMSGPDATTNQPVATMSQEEDRPVLITSRWLDDREYALKVRELALVQREQLLLRNEARLADREQEMELALSVPDPTGSVAMQAGDEKLTAFVDERTGTVTHAAEPGAYSYAKEHGRCYASVFVPAQYRAVAVTKPVEVPKGENLPRIYQTVTEQVKIADEENRWEEVLCEDKVTQCRVTEVQRALFRGGYYAGPIDGIIGRKTLSAMNAFQKEFNLTVTNHLTVETVRALDAYF